MNKNSKKKVKTNINQVQEQSKTCFVIMPISDVDGYDAGHFDRVYEYLIKPACELAGFNAIRADKNNKSNYIVVDILKQIINSDMAICDLSARNSNVFFELGLRQAFNLKTVLIKDQKTPRSFDISGLRCIDYSETLRVDDVKKNVEQISKSLKETYEAKDGDVYSLVQLLAVEGPAKLPSNIKLSDDSSIILSEIKALRNEMNGYRKGLIPKPLFDFEYEPLQSIGYNPFLESRINVPGSQMVNLNGTDESDNVERKGKMI